MQNCDSNKHILCERIAFKNRYSNLKTTWVWFQVAITNFGMCLGMCPIIKLKLCVWFDWIGFGHDPKTKIATKKNTQPKCLTNWAHKCF